MLHFFPTGLSSVLVLFIFCFISGRAWDVVLAALEAHLDEDSRDLLEIEQREQDLFVDDFKSM